MKKIKKINKLNQVEYEFRVLYSKCFKMFVLYKLINQILINLHPKYPFPLHAFGKIIRSLIAYIEPLYSILS